MDPVLHPLIDAALDNGWLINTEHSPSEDGIIDPPHVRVSLVDVQALLNTPAPTLPPLKTKA